MTDLDSIHTFRSEVDRIKRFGGGSEETSICRADFNLINVYAKPHYPLLMISEVQFGVGI